ncbi:hypothetical protein [Aneurinibacillus migulanus]|uniref:Uncharacterized protein n=1 Tax=Aneurinibacillus migulanus TaxID=47500 RepID=A0A1G8V7Y5_ANEMI|nr:hypothetical protein [Aneurinibacillus migulanus]MED0896196.1 hypothetical protein [Aneurinibacillus migulanus]MED1618134.1 hypothetical protein [Aneurinibacillus migulanus]GED17060.1 hypothetical protein AMI01nite_50510 [Aneurinibacillus migulanus]SDJ61967.1 hypothetical protein SAMN04487909_12268 [Aneurinibacillus migulanus]
MDWDLPLILTVLVLAIIVILPLISSFKDRSYRCLIYSALGNDDYFKVTQRLKSKAVPYRTKVIIDSSHPGGGSIQSGAQDYLQYDIYVQKKDEYRANNAIHHYDKIR